MQVPTDEQFFSREDPSKPDIAFLKNHFYREGRLTEDQALYILEKGTEIIRAEPNLLELNAPITGTSLPACSRVTGRVLTPDFHLVCGDIHGQYVRASTPYAFLFLTHKHSLT
jgi:serine/threonine-protein phosphatase 2B catalytic subunit